MRRTTIKWGIGGAVAFPAIVLLLAYFKDSYFPYQSTTLHLLDKALEILTFPLSIWDAILPKHGNPEEAEQMARQFWIPIWTSCVLYLGSLGFGIGILFGQGVRFVKKRSN